MVGLLIFLAGSALMFHLGAGSVPSVLKPLSTVWVHAGYDQKWIKVGLWVLFAFLAVAMLLFVGIPLYSGVVHLGRGSE